MRPAVESIRTELSDSPRFYCSVKDTEDDTRAGPELLMTLNEIADLIISPEVEHVSSGNYLNRRGICGYYLQLKCASSWCKISVSHADRHSDRITVFELDQLDPTTLQPALVIPVGSISAALKSADAERATIETYFNNVAVQGIWAEFYHQGNWYMVRVSRIDLPTRARAEDLERIADEFLWQQGQTHGRRKSVR